MDKIIIQGGEPLRGEVNISGAKNSALPILAAALLAESKSRFKNIPKVKDTVTMLKIISSLGAEITQKDDFLELNPVINKSFASYEFVSTMRASICLLGPLLAKKRKTKISLPGGCAIGPRPIDFHLKGLKKLGAKIKIEKGYVSAQGELIGSNVDLKGPFGSSVLATANIMMAACLAQGKTTIFHPGREPELIDLANFLNKMGAKIKGAGSHRIIIKGVNKLKGAKHRIMPDRIETGTYMIAAAITGG
ncbi:MAG: UDP-N-acetylglucosamine 1-carboxyvinyltransferase, partial [Candidatus Omnitrophica bacterium]|nr:UDP-N-acetylglucosamine 1-carboxyvinyltransferase [Candidatus Omnitrophota bacterium]